MITSKMENITDTFFTDYHNIFITYNELPTTEILMSKIILSNILSPLKNVLCHLRISNDGKMILAICKISQKWTICVNSQNVLKKKKDFS